LEAFDFRVRGVVARAGNTTAQVLDFHRVCADFDTPVARALFQSFFFDSLRPFKIEGLGFFRVGE
jgi:hypothetical protein